jgi:23S rRNA U2552 (ribose-2'-O)-methylase RlmE/FtsJ
VLGVDKENIAPLPFDNVATITADVTDQGLVDEIRSKTNQRFDVLISDLARTFQAYGNLTTHVKLN